MTTFTSSLPKELLAKLDRTAKHLSVPKNRLIEKALSIYLDQITRAEYAKSFRMATEDENLLDMAEEGMEDYLKQLGE